MKRIRGMKKIGQVKKRERIENIRKVQKVIWKIK